MKVDSSVIAVDPEAIPSAVLPAAAVRAEQADHADHAVLWGALGVLAFSMTLPATKVAVHDLDATIVGLGRAVVAGLLAAVTLAVTRQPAPPRVHWGRLVAVAIGCVAGYSFLSAVALVHVPSAHAAVITGLAPAATAVMAVWRGGERPSRAFWIACAAGLAAVLAFAIARGAGRLHIADLYILIAIIIVGWGYAEGAVAARDMGGWQVICWALVISLPVLGPVVLWRAATHGLSAGPAAWIAFAYISLFSMFLGMFAWYRGLAQGGIARIGQLQLAQPVLTLIWSALLLGERITLGMGVASLAVVASVAATQRARVKRVG